MTKKDIKEGAIVLLKDGRRCIVMPDITDELVLYGLHNLRNPFCSDCYTRPFGKVSRVDNYRDDLTTLDDDVYTIMAVRSNPITTASSLFKILTSNSIDKDDIIWDWKREEVKEVTIAEVEEKFGCKVKIVKEE